MLKTILFGLLFCGLMAMGLSMLVWYGKPVIEEAIRERLAYKGYLH